MYKPLYENIFENDTNKSPRGKDYEDKSHYLMKNILKKIIKKANQVYKEWTFNVYPKYDIKRPKTLSQLLLFIIRSYKFDVMTKNTIICIFVGSLRKVNKDDG